MIIDGKKIADQIQDEVKKEIAQIKGRKPGLAFVLVGDDPASRTYIKMKKAACAKVGILSFDREFPSSTSQKDLIAAIENLNSDPHVDGILVQLPLPSHIETHKVMEAVSYKKDVDGFHPLNMGKLLLGETDGFFPCTPFGIVTLLEKSFIPTAGKHVVIVGRSNIVGKPLAALLMQKKPHANATVTVAHSYSERLKEICRSADILIAAIGRPLFITQDMVKEGSVVIDVGITRLEKQGKASFLVGDVDFENVAPLASAITPVPGGVGPMTIAKLLSNTLLSYRRKSL